MAIEVFKNDEDDILFGQDGNIFRTPYDFGRAFQNKMGLNNYVVISGLSFVPPFSILQWDNSSTETTDYSGPHVSLRSSASKWYSLNRWYGSSNTVRYDLYNRTSSGGGVSYVDAISQGLHLLTAIHQSSSMQVIVDVTAANSGINNDNPTIDAIYIGADRGNLGSTPTIIGAAFIKQGRVVVFNRVVSISEIKYYYDNKSGNDLQSTVGLMLDLRMQQAEVINISGVDQPCVRDYSGNNYHGIIMNLPAGTAQQKVDYANANLFVQFIS